jgi:hypothetical protein
MRATVVLIGRILLVAATLGVVGYAIDTAIQLPSAVVSGLTPLVIAGGLLLTVHHGYLAIRAIRWKFRQRLEKQELARLGIPSDVPDQSAFPGVADINKRQHEVLRDPPDFQGRMYSRGVKIAVLPAIAVLLAALPTVRPNDRWWIIGAAAGELLALVVVLSSVHSARKPSAPWVLSRTRAELLRREQYLRLAHVGPYLNLGEAAADGVTTARLAELTHEPEPARFIPMRDTTTGRRWIDELWLANPYGQVSRVRDRARSYLHYRIDKQIMWFTLAAKATRSAVQGIATTIRIALGLGIAVGIGQFVLFVAWPDAATTNFPSPAQVLTALFLIVLPPLTAFLMAIQELYSYRGLAASYEQMLGDLRTERAALASFVERLDGDSDARGREFQAFVLHVESALTVELQSWILITEREEFQIEG